MGLFYKIPSEMEVAPRYELLALVTLVRAGVKKLFFTFGQNGGGSQPIKKILIRKYSDILPKREGLTQSKRVLSDFLA